jgi:archaellum component FlaC
MNDQQVIDKLEGLRTKVLDDIVSMADEIIGHGEADLETLLTISRSTGNVELLVKAYEKCQAIENSADKTDALITILEEIEERIADIESDAIYTENAPENEETEDQSHQENQANGE